jgi:hypothetical protein
MQKIEFRRNHVNKRSGPISKRSIFIAIALFIVLVIIVVSQTPTKEIHHFSVINVTFLPKNQYLIEKDTSNYENFASVLRDKISEQKNKVIELRIILPKHKTMEEVEDIIQIANAFDKVNLRLLTEK